MSADERIDELMGHITRMLDILVEIQVDMRTAGDEESCKPAPDSHKQAFYASQMIRAQSLADQLDNDISSKVYGLKNLAGPIKYLQEE